MPALRGLKVLKRTPQITPTAQVVMATAITDAKPAVDAMKLGAVDYLNKPFDVAEIRLVVERILKQKLEQATAASEPTAPPPSMGRFENFIGTSPAMQEVYSLIQRLMDTESTVLVHGETGTGK